MPRIEVTQDYSDSENTTSLSVTPTATLSLSNFAGQELMEDVRYALETGNLAKFKETVDSNIQDFNFGYVYSDSLSFPMILIQTYKKIELGKQQELQPEEFSHCLKWLARKGANINHQDSNKRSLIHWCVLTQCPEMLLQATLDAGGDPKLQDNEGQTAIHLCIRMACASTLDSIVQICKDKTILETPSFLSGATPLIYAVQISSYDFVRQIVGYGVNVNTKESNKYERTALHYAIYVNRTDIFEFLLRKGARTDLKDYKGKTVENRAEEHPHATFKKMIQVYSRVSLDEDMSSEFHPTTPLMVACQNGEFDTAQNLVDNGADISAVDDGGKNALHYCADSEETACAELLLERNMDLTSKKDADGYTPLHLATIAGNVKLMHILLQYNADVNALDNEKHSPVHWAVVCGQSEALKTLLEHKARIALPDIFGAYPLHYAAQICGTNGDAKDDKTAFRILEMLIAKKTRIDCLDFEKRTPLLWAASMGSVTACELLIKSGAKVQHGDRAGLTVLHCAASRGHDAIIELLITKYEADVNQGDKNDCTPLFYAVTLNQEKCVEVLMDSGADLNVQDKKGRTVAHCAASRNILGILKMLSVRGANMWIQNTVGDLPLHEAVENNLVDAVKFLAADPNATLDVVNNRQQAALHMAAYKNQVQIVNAILRHNNDIVNQRTVSDQGNSVTACDLTTNSECKDFLRRYAGLKAFEIDGSEPFEDQQTITVVAPFGKSSRSPRKISVNSKPYAEAIKKAEEIMALRDKDEDIQSERDETRLESRRSSLISIKEEQEPRSRRPSGSKADLPVIKEKKDAETITELDKASANQLSMSVRSTSTSDLRRKIAEKSGSPHSSRSSSKVRKDEQIVNNTNNNKEGRPEEGNDAASLMSSESMSLPDIFDDEVPSKPHLNKRHKVPFFWEKKTEAPAQAMKIKKNKPSHERIHESVEEYERLKQISRKVHDSKRAQLRDGPYSDKIILRLLLEEYRRYCMQEYDFDEAGYDDSDTEKIAKNKKMRSKSDDSSSSKASKNSSKGSLSKSQNIKEKDSEDNEASDHEEAATVEKRKKKTKKKSRREDPEFEAILKETKNLYQQVQKQADETLKLARKMNEVMTQDYSQKKEKSRRPRTTIKREPMANGTSQNGFPNPVKSSAPQRHVCRHGDKESSKVKESVHHVSPEHISSSQRPKTGRAKLREDQIRKAYTTLPPVVSPEERSPLHKQSGGISARSPPNILQTPRKSTNKV